MKKSELKKIINEVKQELMNEARIISTSGDVMDEADSIVSSLEDLLERYTENSEEDSKDIKNLAKDLITMFTHAIKHTLL